MLGYWKHDLNPFVVSFPEGSMLEGIRWYGLMYVIAFLIAGCLLHLYWQKRRSPLCFEEQNRLLTSLIIGIYIGGRLGYLLFYDFEGFIAKPWIFFEVWKGGMSSHGGFVGVALVLWGFAKYSKEPFFCLSDMVVTLAPAGIFLGRIANFINGELWGKVTTVSWGVLFPLSAHGQDISPRHPSQLYEAFLEGIVLLVYTQWRFWRRKPGAIPGKLTGEFLFLYACLRIGGEGFREPDAGLIWGMSRGIFLSLFLALMGLIVWGLSFGKSGEEVGSGK